MTSKLSIIVPYYNERDYLPATLESLGCQTDHDFCLILVDNGSADDSTDLARSVMQRFPDIETHFLSSSPPGQLPTLEHGLTRVTTDYVASCDADTIYPPHYVENCIAMFEGGQGKPVVGVMAVDLYSPLQSEASTRRIQKIMRKARIFRSQCHAGGYAQVYRTDVLRAAGGFQSPQWPYLLYDHELYQRIRKSGVIKYSPNHYCFPSDRRTDRQSVGWTWLERTIYRFTPSFGKDWFFYSFLAPRFARRGLVQVKLRERNFQTSGVSGHGE